ncbi:hypothetical protein E2C01_024069 [Portunus trituberculatus]|uniref:Uncharacterized protein n=1 Tax=Portunus trituberculatus TaxID=210409 RepID=A0A5B7E9F6_PORTR|nr:hypothetical protein [Portunus trituberculatus]
MANPASLARDAAAKPEASLSDSLSVNRSVQASAPGDHHVAVPPSQPGSQTPTASMLRGATPRMVPESRAVTREPGGARDQILRRHGGHKQ